MSRHISFALTTLQFKNRTKTVTRRMGWKDLKPGDILIGVVKSQGLKRGEKAEVLGTIRVVSVERQFLNRLTAADSDYGYAEMAKEGFPYLAPAEFVAYFCQSHKACTPESEVTRIEYEYL